MQFSELPSSAHAVFAVSWGYDVDVGLVVTKRNWGMILRGRDVTLRGKGYVYDGESFNDIWHFRGGLDGYLEINYGQRKVGDYSGQGYRGTPRDALLGTRDDTPPASFEHNGLEFWDRRLFFEEDPMLSKIQQIVKNVESPPDESTHDKLEQEAEWEKRRLSLEPFVLEIECAVNDWKLSLPDGSGFAWGYRRALNAREPLNKLKLRRFPGVFDASPV